MKEIFCLFLMLTISKTFASEITLVCRGTNNFYSSAIGSKTYPESIEVRFDDVLNKVLYVDPSKVYGCYGEEIEYERSCDCSVNDTNIRCISKSKTKSGSFQSNQTVNVNRFSGILDFSEITSGNDKDGKYFMTQSGKLQCESFTKKKF